MRDRKYRVWGTNDEYPEGKMYYPGDLPIVITLFGDPIHASSGNKIEDCCYMRVGWNDVDVMDYTGLHDKNGKEIYEGDIITDDSFADDHVLWKAVVEWHEYGAWGIKEVTPDYGVAMLSAYAPTTQCKVIGNIHQHPDLLNKE